MNHVEICLDLSVPLQMRLEHLTYLSSDEVDTILECMCSMYNIHPTFLGAQYLQCLILQNHACLRRRVRIAEACDLGRTVLYLLTRIPNVHERIACIEMFSNPFLKVHAYAVLYTRASIDTRIQIMKNLYRLSTLRADYIRWFLEQMRNESLDYTCRANCADFLLRHAFLPEHQHEARVFLKLVDPVVREQLYEHHENVHLFVPRVHVLERILRSGTPRTDKDDILRFLLDRQLDDEIFIRRIFNDKTILGTLQWKCTLEDLLCLVWTGLTDELRELLAHDIESSSIVDESDSGWTCTTGYYNRILNIYQAAHDEIVFDMVHDREAFQEAFTHRLNQELQGVDDEDEKGNIFMALTESSEAARIRYLTFRIQSLPRVIEEMRFQYKELSDDQFTAWIADALRMYEQ